MSNSHSDVLLPFHRVSNLRGTWDLLSVYAAVFALATLASTWQNPFFTVLAIIIIGGLQNRLVSLQHDAWHHLCFSSKKVNDIVCAWLTAYAVGASYRFNKQRHSGHHAYFGSERDPDRVTFINDGRDTPLHLIRYFVYILLGGTIIEKVRMIFNKEKIVGTENLPSPSAELGCVAAAQMLLLLLFAFTGHWFNYALFWFLPLVTFAAFFTTARQFIEHASADNNAAADDRLFDFQAGAIEQFFIAPAHFQHHAFHHAFPKIPHYRLQQAKAEARARGVTYKGQMRAGYIAAFAQHMRDLEAWKRKMVAN